MALNSKYGVLDKSVRAREKAKTKFIVSEALILIPFLV